MKRIFILSVVLLGIIYVMPLFSAQQSELVSAETTEENTLPTLRIDQPEISEPALYDPAQTITLLAGGEIQTLALSDYLTGVLFAEMPASFPDEALKAQTVAARTYTLYKMRVFDLSPNTAESHGGAALCDDPAHCKAYLEPTADTASRLWGANAPEYHERMKKAVRDTDGEILTYQDEPIAAVFHAVSAEKTESSADIWGTETPYLVSVDSPGGEDDPSYSGTAVFTDTQFRNLFLAAYPAADLSALPTNWFKSSVRSDAGSVLSVEVGGVRVSGAAIRSLFGLSSANFTLSATENSITFHTVGRGHGVGMSQYGARRMALSGSGYQDILSHYYQNTSLEKKVA